MRLMSDQLMRTSLVVIFMGFVLDTTMVGAFLNRNVNTNPNLNKTAAQIPVCNGSRQDLTRNATHFGDPLPADKFTRLCELPRPAQLPLMCAGSDLYGVCYDLCVAQLGFSHAYCICLVPDEVSAPGVGLWLCGCTYNPGDRTGTQPGWYWLSGERLQPGNFLMSDQQCDNGITVVYSRP